MGSADIINNNSSYSLLGSFINACKLHDTNDIRSLNDVRGYVHARSLLQPLNQKVFICGLHNLGDVDANMFFSHTPPFNWPV